MNKTISFVKPREGRFVKLTALSGFDTQPFTSLTEFEAITKD
jgi:hypothetical protein